MTETGRSKTPANPVHQLIERWWEDHFPGSAVARDTAGWNIAHAAKEALKGLLCQEPRPQEPRPQEPRLGENPPRANIGTRRGSKDSQGSI
ncbi:MAG: hypothetical protein ACREE9_17650 [Stellaceae bacterium]